MLSEEEILARLKPGCICKGIKLYKIQKAIDNGATTYEDIVKVTGIGGGSCNSKRCSAKVTELLHKQKPTDSSVIANVGSDIFHTDFDKK